jgi:hypothetical protein
MSSPLSAPEPLKELLKHGRIPANSMLQTKFQIPFDLVNTNKWPLSVWMEAEFEHERAPRDDVKAVSTCVLSSQEGRGILAMRSHIGRPLVT